MDNMNVDSDMEMAITPTTSHQNLPSQFSYRNRADSLISIDTTYTVRTNVEQTQFPNGVNPQLNFQRNRQNSDVSLASSVFSEMPKPQMDNYQFTKTFDDELYSYYIAYSQQPNITPFDIRFPPSGILSLISKLFLENCILNNDYTPIQIDLRNDINNEILLDSNRHSCLTIIRLRLIHLCNINLRNNHDDQFMYSDQLPISRTNSCISAVSINDRVAQNIACGNISNSDQWNVLSSQSQPQPQTQPQQMARRPSWLHFPISSTKSRDNSLLNNINHNMMLSSTDSLIDRTQLQTGDFNEDSTLAFTTPVAAPKSQCQSQTLTPPQSSSNINPPKRDRPLLNLHMPSTLQNRSGNSNTNLTFNLPPRPIFSISGNITNSTPGTPGTPGTPSTPVSSLNNANLQRNPRGLRSGSLTNAGPTYFNLPLTNSNGNPNNSGISNTNHKSYINPTLNNILGSPNELNSPFEQSFPSPIGLAVSQSVPQPVTPGGNEDLYNATVSRKRDSLKLKRGLN